MHRLSLTLVLLSTALALGYDGRIVLTTDSGPWGLTHPENMLAASTNTGLDYTSGAYAVGAFPPPDQPGSTVVTVWDRVYIWGQFDASLPKGTRIVGLQIGITDDWGQHLELDSAFYACDDSLGLGRRRWSGGAPWDFLEDQNPQVMVAITDWGISKAGEPVPWNLYSGPAGGNYFLLGAFQFDLDESPRYTVSVEQIGYESGAPGAWQSAQVYIPEPAAGLALVALALLRRR